VRAASDHTVLPALRGRWTTCASVQGAALGRFIVRSARFACACARALREAARAERSRKAWPRSPAPGACTGARGWPHPTLTPARPPAQAGGAWACPRARRRARTAGRSGRRAPAGQGVRPYTMRSLHRVLCGRMGVRAHACRTRVCAQRAHACRNERIRAGTARERARLRCTAEGAGGAQERMDMEDCRIPEEYFTCHADSLFDLLAGELARFARHRCAPGPGAAYRQQGARACLLSARRSDTASVRRGRAARRPPGRQRTPCNLHSCTAAVLVMLGPAAPQPVPHGPPRRGRAEPRALCGGG